MKTIRLQLAVIFLSLLCSGKTLAQDFQLTQFYASPVLLNPAFTGGDVCSRVTLSHRNQWPGIGEMYKTSVVSFDHSLRNAPIGLGIIVANDQSGSGALRTTAIRPSFAYETRIKKKLLLRFGLQTGVGIKSIDFSRLTFGDQLYRGGSQVATVEKVTQSKTYFDVNSGVLLSNKNFWCGASFNHLNQPNESFYEGSPSRLPMEISVHAGAKFQVNGGERDVYEQRFFTPIIHYRAQEKFDQLDLGFYYSKHIFTFGFWYRGIPLLKAYKPGYSNNDAVAFLAGIQTSRIKVGYSYDITISGISAASKGAHEVSLSFQLCNVKKRKTKLVLISCPKF